MDLVFDTNILEPAKRYTAWREAICDVYVHVDVKATQPEDYKGFIREQRFGDVTLTDILVSEQRIRRNRQHIAKLDKDCYYIQFVHKGHVTVLQKGESHESNMARAAIFSAADPYELRCIGEGRSLYLEVPREDFAQRFPRDRIPLVGTINSTQGLGRIAADFCTTLAKEGGHLSDDVRASLGSQLLDVLAFTLMSADGEAAAAADSSIQKARLRSIQQWIEDHINEPNLTLERIAIANNISLRYLHVLFRQCDVSAAEWIRNRRLQLCYDEIARGGGRSITSIAFDHGFNSSAHFSTLFRRKFGLSPRDVGRTRE